MKTIFSILVLLFCCVFSYASNLITPKEAYELIQEGNTSVIACQKAKDYKLAHITGAVHILHSDLYKQPTSMGLIKEAEELATYFGNLGISDKHTIMLYDDGSNKYAGRVYWILTYLGAKNVKIIDGHYDAWFNAGLPVTKNRTPIKQAEFLVNLQNKYYVDMDYVKSNINNENVLLVDVRSKEEFKGLNGKTDRKGHIPGALHFYYEWVLDMDHNYKTKEQILKIVKANGFAPGKEIILYCATSVKASVVFFALQSICLCPNVKVYDGAYKEWASYTSNTIAQ